MLTTIRTYIYPSIIFIIILFLTGFTYGYQDYPWKEITDRQQIQIDECQRDIRDYSKLERDIKELQSRVLFLEDQIELLLESKTSRAFLSKRWNNLGVGE